MIRGKFGGIGDVGKTVCMDRPLVQKAVASVESALQRVIFGNRPIRVNHNNSIIGGPQSFLRSISAQHQFDHVVKQPNSERSRVYEIDIQKPGKPPSVLRRLKRGFTVGHL